MANETEHTTSFFSMRKSIQKMIFLSYLDGCLRQVVGISQLGGDVELEVLRVLDGRVTQLDTEAAALLECLFQQQGLQDGIQLLLNVLKQHLV